MQVKIDGNLVIIAGEAPQRAMAVIHWTGVYFHYEGKFPCCNSTDHDKKCYDCNGPGWGPMLTTNLWADVCPQPKIRIPQRKIFLCEPCMETRLARPLKPGDLRDCPMNVFHPCYLNNGVE